MFFCACVLGVWAEFAIGNIVRRILYVIREEYHNEELRSRSTSTTSKHNNPNSLDTAEHSDAELDDQEGDEGDSHYSAASTEQQTLLSSSSMHSMHSPALFMLGGADTHQEYNKPIENYRIRALAFHTISSHCYTSSTVNIHTLLLG
jgi:hypothetical protein